MYTISFPIQSIIFAHSYKKYIVFNEKYSYNTFILFQMNFCRFCLGVNLLKWSNTIRSSIIRVP